MSFLLKEILHVMRVLDPSNGTFLMHTDGLNGYNLLFRLDLNMELPQGQTGSVGTTVASAEQVRLQSMRG